MLSTNILDCFVIIIRCMQFKADQFFFCWCCCFYYNNCYCTKKCLTSILKRRNWLIKLHFSGHNLTVAVFGTHKPTMAHICYRRMEKITTIPWMFRIPKKRTLSEPSFRGTPIKRAKWEIENVTQNRRKKELHNQKMRDKREQKLSLSHSLCLCFSSMNRLKWKYI